MKTKQKRESTRIPIGIQEVEVWLHPLGGGRTNFQFLAGWDGADYDLTRKQLEKIRDGIAQWLEAGNE